MKQPCVYIVANRRRGTIYTGVTSNPPRRAFEHHEGLVKGFSARYCWKTLVSYELHDHYRRHHARKADQGRQPSEEIRSDRGSQSRLERPIQDADLATASSTVIARSEATKQSSFLRREGSWIASLRSQ